MTDENEIADFLDALRFKGSVLRGQNAGPKVEYHFNTKELNVCGLSLKQWEGTGFKPDVKPLFKAQALNFCILTKEVVPKHMDISLRPYQLATKVFFPYDVPQAVALTSSRDGQSIAGRSFYVGQRKYTDILNNFFMGGLSEQDRTHDLDILDGFSSIPSLDPFLIRDKFETENIPIDPAYLTIEPARWAAMKDRIIEEFSPIAMKAFGSGRDLRQKTSVLVDKLWEATDLKALAPLTAALQLKPDQAAEVYYAWKGILFYRQQYQDAIKRLDEFFVFFKTSHDWMSKVPGVTVDYNWNWIIKQINIMTAEVRYIMERYEEITKAFYETGSRLGDFIRFFNMAPDFFWLLGSNLACFDHCLQKVRDFKRNTFPNVDSIDDLFRSLYAIASFADRS